MSKMGSSSLVLLPLDTKTMTSPFCGYPVALWTASAGEMKRLALNAAHEVHKMLTGDTRMAAAGRCNTRRGSQKFDRFLIGCFIKVGSHFPDALGLNSKRRAGGLHRM